MDAKSTGELIAARRRALGLNQTELAERLHVTDKAVSKWETGRGMPGIDSLEPLAEVLGLSVSELLSGRELTREELPGTAGGQIVESMRRQSRMAWRGALAALLAVALTAGAYLALHYFTTVKEDDLTGIARQAAGYLKAERTLRVVETERRGDYLAALCLDEEGLWRLCVYDRDKVFSDRWRGNGGKQGMKPGKLGSWNYGNPREAVIIFCGGDLPEEAAYYTFRNSGIDYVCPIENRRVLDVFVLPDTGDISSYPEDLLDGERRPLEIIASEGAAVPADAAD